MRSNRAGVGGASNWRTAPQLIAYALDRPNRHRMEPAHPFVARPLGQVNPTEFLLPMFVGGLLYLLWRPPMLLMFDWTYDLGLSAPLAAIREFMSPLGRRLPASLLFSLPAAMWSYSIITWIRWSWRGCIGVEARIWILVAACVGPLSEILQAVGALPGTFDRTDLVAYTAASILGVLRISGWRLECGAGGRSLSSV